MAEKPIDIAKKLVQLRNDLDALWESTSSKKKRAEIVKSMAELDKEVMRLISINIDTDSAYYGNATTALAASNTKLRKAKTNIDSFVEAMEAVAKALDLVREVAPV